MYNQSSQKRQETDKEWAKVENKRKVIAFDLHYKNKLGCHNFTIFDLGTKDITCYFWHEAGGDLRANAFASYLTDYLENLEDGIKEVVMFSDGCT